MQLRCRWHGVGQAYMHMLPEDERGCTNPNKESCTEGMCWGTDYGEVAGKGIVCLVYLWFHSV
jgi:hypothetical protein